MEKRCKNCNETITGKFCANCGQKTNISRYSIKYFIVHDIIQGFWNIDNGIFFTIKELFTRPGHSIREFIEGKRVRHFNFVTLFLIILGVALFVGEYSLVSLTDLMPESSKEPMGGVEAFTKEYPKITLLIAIPFYSVFSFLWFRKSKLNIIEHFVLNSYKAIAEFIIELIFTIITVFYTNKSGLMPIYSSIVFLSLFYGFWYYKQFFSAYGYSKKALLARSFGVIFSYMLFSMTLGAVLAIISKAL